MTSHDLRTALESITLWDCRAEKYVTDYSTILAACEAYTRDALHGDLEIQGGDAFRVLELATEEDWTAACSGSLAF